MIKLQFIEICLAGGLGALTRFSLTRLGNFIFNRTALPVATLFINLLGAFLLGAFAGHFNSTSLAWLLGSGFLGGFTTFSTFTNEVISLTDNHSKIALIYLIVSIIGGIGLAQVGYLL